jgi:hypothetical protein
LVRACDISELSLVPSISRQSSNHDFFCVGVMYSGECDVSGVTLTQGSNFIAAIA